MRSCLLFLLLCLQLLLNCQRPATAEEEERAPFPLDTFILVQQQCGRCHQLPSPSDLPALTWEKEVLPRMGAFLGIYDSSYTRNALLEVDAPSVLAQNIYPEENIISAAEWEAIQAFYISMAPDSLYCPNLELAATQGIFTVHLPKLRADPPGTLLAQFSPIAGYFVGDVQQAQLYYFNSQHERQAIIEVPGGPIQLQTSSRARYILSVGSFSPTDQAVGNLWQLPARMGEEAQLLVSQLQRPVHFKLDPRTQAQAFPAFLIAEYGKWTGRLAYWQADQNGHYSPTPLWERSGAITADWVDIDGDGQLEVVALFGQGQEGIWIFELQPDGNFHSQVAVSFPPSYGSSSMQFIDWNKDGLVDILYTNGDNADYAPVLKPYHGIRIFLNRGNKQFTEHLFLPLPGAYGCAAADFDLDGDRDLVAISFFPDFGHQPQQGLILFEQKAVDQFTAHPFAEAPLGRWIRIAYADNDGDGDQDLLVGSMAFEVIPDQGELDRWLANGLGWLYFE